MIRAGLKTPKIKTAAPTTGRRNVAAQFSASSPTARDSRSAIYNYPATDIYFPAVREKEKPMRNPNVLSVNVKWAAVCLLLILSAAHGAEKYT
jgi:hypothetical protein